MHDMPFQQEPPPQLKLKHYTIWLTSFEYGGLVWYRGARRPHMGPTVELTVEFPRDPPRTFNIPFPIYALQHLRKVVSRYGLTLETPHLKILRDAIHTFGNKNIDYLSIPLPQPARLR
jgi:hypothetical protein